MDPRFLRAVVDNVHRAQVIDQRPESAEAQAIIEDAIRRERVEENRLAALEHFPESFGSVTMLYVPAAVHRVPLLAFVDCGAQMTILSESAAQRCGLMPLLDERYAGVARGVGSAPILGRVHSAALAIGDSCVIQTAFSVLRGPGPDILLGLDTLRRHRCCIDLAAGVLRIGEYAIPFLPEHEIASQRDVFQDAAEASPEDPVDAAASVPPPSPSPREPAASGHAASLLHPRPLHAQSARPSQRPRLQQHPEAVPRVATEALPPQQTAAGSDHSAILAYFESMGFARVVAEPLLESVQWNVELALQLLLT